LNKSRLLPVLYLSESIIFFGCINCTIRYSTRVIPFHVDFRPGATIYEQVVYAAMKAMMAGQLRPGDAFPSVRTLSRELKINPNTAHKVITNLVSSGLLEIRPGAGTLVATRPQASRVEKTHLLEQQVEQLVVESKRLGIELTDLQEAVEKHWKRLKQRASERTSKGREATIHDRCDSY
jgi:DNA-binding transcriptional regulator YhcF (GntR family)